MLTTGSSSSSELRNEDRLSQSDSMEISPKPKKFKSDTSNIEPFHFVTNIESVKGSVDGELYECMECMVQFQTSYQLLQHPVSYCYILSDKVMS